MRNTISEWVFNIVVLIFATSTIAQPFVIPSGSMESTLMTGDHVIVNKQAYENIKRNDIIVFRYPPDIRQNYVKRVVGIPGDRIRIVDKQLYRNGQKVNEPYTQHVFPGFAPYRDNFPRDAPPNLPWLAQQMLAANQQNGEIVVPPENYFAMGDNRDNSEDSRYWGFVPAENITGKPILVYWSYDASTEDLSEYTWRHATDLAQHFFTKTRWDRTLKPIRP